MAKRGQKRHREPHRPRTAVAMRPATIEVFAAAQIDVLSVGHGHMEIKIEPGDEKSIAEAKALIASMLTRGFAIFIEHPDGSTSRVKGFDPDHFAYLIDPDEDATERPARGTEPTPITKPVKKRTRRVPVGGTTTVAVGRTAGG